jgi:cytochrome b involved in lipid metabolism|tara:strand:+ start:526 stop:777 length:252 start_codon:yes stop_codon:yes gene_type:complete
MTTFYTEEEVEKHDTSDNCWCIANNNVYNVTDFLNRHPGGRFVLLSKGGQNVTKHYSWHPPHAKKIWEKYKIGEIAKQSTCCL